MRRFIKIFSKAIENTISPFLSSSRLYCAFISIASASIGVTTFPTFCTAEQKTYMPSEAANQGLRTLPYPFRIAFSVADDVDGSSWRGDKAIKDELRKRFGFNWGRSIHVYARPQETDGFLAFTNKTRGEPSAFIVNANDYPNSTYQLLRSYNRGEIDYVHMWSDMPQQEGVPALVPRQVLEASSDITSNGKSEEIEIIRNEPIHFPGLRFYLTRSEGIEGIRILIQNTTGHEFSICLGRLHVESDCLWKLQLPTPNSRTLKAFFFEDDSNKELYERLRPLGVKWRSLRVEVEGSPGSKAVIDEIMYSIFNRSLVERQVNWMQRLNMGFWSYSDHGGNDNSINLFNIPSKDGIRIFDHPHNWSRKDPLTGVMASYMAEGSKPGSDYYFDDLLKSHGSVFYMFGNDNHQNYLAENQLRPYNIEDILIPYQFPSGRQAYNVRRWFPGIWKNGDKGEHYSITWNDRFGQVLDYILNQSKNEIGFPVFGPIVTHLAFASDDNRNGRPPHSIKENDAFNEEGDIALGRLAERYYNFSGNTTNKDRVWAPSANRLYRYSQVYKQIAAHIRYEENGIIRINSWQDPITGEILPSAGSEGKDLSGITLYIPNNTQVSVKINDKLFYDFVRNPPDDTGRSSITFVDLTTLTVVADETWRTEALSSSSIQDTASAPSGRRILQVKSGERAVIPLSGFERDTTAQTNFNFFARTNSKTTKAKVSYKLNDGRVYNYSIGAVDAEEPGWFSPWLGGGGWERYIGEFNRTRFSVDNKEHPPRGLVNEIIIESLDGDTEIDLIAFGRDNPNPHIASGNLVGGRVSDLRDDTLVRLHTEGETTRETKTANTGYFLFEGVPTGAVVSLEILNESGSTWYQSGKKIELHRDIVDLDILINNLTSAEFLHKSLGKDRIAHSDGLVPRTRSYVKTIDIKGMSPSNKYRLYQANGLIHWMGTATQEYDTYQYANSDGFLDIERDYTKKTDFNIAFLGTCFFEGAQFSTKDKLGVQLERLFQSDGLKIQAPIFANTQFRLNHYVDVYRDLARKYRPKLVIVDLSFASPEVLPSIEARSYGLEVEAFPYSTLDIDAAGNFTERPRDPAYAMKSKKWNDPLDAFALHYPYIINPTDYIAKEARRAWLVELESLRRLKNEVESDGGRLILALVQDRPSFDVPMITRVGQFDVNYTEIHNQAQKLAEALNVTFFDFVHAIEARKDAHKLQWVFDGHWTPEGHHMAAEIFYQFIKEKDLIPVHVNQ